MQVPIQDNIHSIIIQQLLHGLTHALVLQVVSGVCIQATHTFLLTGTPADARYLLGMSQATSERRLALTV